MSAQKRMNIHEVQYCIREHLLSIGIGGDDILFEFQGGVVLYLDLAITEKLGLSPPEAYHLKVSCPVDTKQKNAVYFVDNEDDRFLSIHLFDTKDELKEILSKIIPKTSVIGRLLEMETKLDTLLKTINKQPP